MPGPIVDPPAPSIGGFLDQGLDLIMANVSQLIAFADGGTYCNYSAPFFSHQVPGFTDSPKTYITSALLQHCGWSGSSRSPLFTVFHRLAT